MKIYMTSSLLALREEIASEIYFCSIYFCDLGPQNQRNLLNFFFFCVLIVTEKFYGIYFLDGLLLNKILGNLILC